MDMEWIMTFASPLNETAQISIVKKESPMLNILTYPFPLK